MAGQIEPIARMAQQLSRLPGIGAKTAQRLAYHIVSLPEDQVHRLASAIWQGQQGGEILLDLRQLHGGRSLPDLCG